MSEAWHTLDRAALVGVLGTNLAAGLEQEEAALRLARDGPNELAEQARQGPWSLLLDQLRSTVVIILLAAAVTSGVLGAYKDALAILVIVALNALLGFRQEYRAERALAALKRLAMPTVHVRRGGQTRELPVGAIVRGDLVILEAGNSVPADGRLVESAGLRVQEAALTGESEPVDKTPALLQPSDLALAERHNMVYMGTFVTYGRGLAVVTETGMATELGRIATLLQRLQREQTPLQRRLDALGRRLAWLALAIVAVIFMLGLLRGEAPLLLVMTAVSIAVAAIPEGLPAVVTIALALGAQRMLKRRALIRKLPAVETLGSVTVICSDKTGTLTQNTMRAIVFELADSRVEPGASVGDLQPSLQLLLTAAALCNDAVLDPSMAADQTHAILGDPTEAALIKAAAQIGLFKHDLEQHLPRVAELPFDSERKRMTTVHVLADPASHSLYGQLAALRPRVPPDIPLLLAFTKGAVDGLLERTTGIWDTEQITRVNETWRGRIEQAQARIAEQGMRVIGVACRVLPPATSIDEAIEDELVFLGLIGLADPIRPEVRDAVATCMAAGIRPVMITGDHPLTALAIGRQLGIGEGARVVTGPQLAQCSSTELDDLVSRCSIYARVAPEHKLAIVQALQRQGQIVAMTGDGVNDAPALKQADIGVAMGITGSDVAREAADMVLLDDNFATIVAAVEEGRVIYDNIRKFITYILSGNIGEILVMLLALLAGMPLPLLPLQILWVNLVTDGLPSLALGVEPAERQIMRRPPYAPGESIFSQGVGLRIAWGGLLIGLVSLGLGYASWRAGAASWQTLVFTTLTLSQLWNALALRSQTDSLWTIGITSNRYLLGAVLLTVALQLAVIYLPLLQGFFQTVALSAGELGLSLLLSTTIFWALELAKWRQRRSHGVQTFA